MNIEVRQANYEDIPSLQKMVSETIEEICSKDYNAEQIRVWKHTISDKDKWTYKIDTQLVEVAIKEEQIAGIATLEHNSYIDLMYVHKNFQGKRIAGYLLERIAKYALTNNSNKLESDVSITARPFFESKGFKHLKTNRKELDGIELINYRMRKLL